MNMEVSMNKTSIKLFTTIFLIITILLSSASFALATDDSLYVWSSSSNTLNNTENTTNSSNTTITNNTSTNVTNSTTNTNNTINTTNNTNVNTSTNIATNVSNVEDDSSVLTNATSEVTDDNSLNLESESAILIEQSSGRILYAHNIHEQLRPASVTKVMSILLIMEALDSRKN